jgi:hypothetical protein
LGTLKEMAKGRKKWRMLVEEKTRSREWTNVKWTQAKAMANPTEQHYYYYYYYCHCCCCYYYYYYLPFPCTNIQAIFRKF